jgi:serine/threonine protein kinase
MNYQKNLKLFYLSADHKENVVSNDSVFYSLSYLTVDERPIFGGNGVVFNVTSSEDNLDYVIKICRFSDEEAKEDRKARKRVSRFEKEIEALSIAKDEGMEDVIKIICSGDVRISKLTFRYFIMEKCDSNLGEYLNREGIEISDSQKLVLFHRIVKGIKQLHDFKIYHRDIKFDNIFFRGDSPKVGDLGLVYNRNSEVKIFEKGEPIGPYGWLSPEATNKFLVENTPNLNKHDCFIDTQSDVFQLGKLCWYIFNGNLPLGQLLLDDFIPADETLFDIIFSSLQYSKARRLHIEELLIRVEELFPQYNL